MNISTITSGCIDCGGTGQVVVKDHWVQGFLRFHEVIMERCKCQDADFADEPTKPQHQRPNVPPVLM